MLLWAGRHSRGARSLTQFCQVRESKTERESKKSRGRGVSTQPALCCPDNTPLLSSPQACGGGRRGPCLQTTHPGILSFLQPVLLPETPSDPGTWSLTTQIYRFADGHMCTKLLGQRDKNKARPQSANQQYTELIFQFCVQFRIELRIQFQFRSSFRVQNCNWNNN